MEGEEVFGGEGRAGGAFDGAVEVFVLHVEEAADGLAVDEDAEGAVGVGLRDVSGYGV